MAFNVTQKLFGAKLVEGTMHAGASQASCDTVFNGPSRRHT